jgi:hypothetical protein
VSYELPSTSYTGHRAKNKPRTTFRGYLIDKKYFARNPFVMNILQTLNPCKPLKTSILRPKYPKEGEGVPPKLEREKEAETHRSKQEEF